MTSFWETPVGTLRLRVPETTIASGWQSINASANPIIRMRDDPAAVAAPAGEADRAAG